MLEYFVQLKLYNREVIVLSNKFAAKKFNYFLNYATKLGYQSRLEVSALHYTYTTYVDISMQGFDDATNCKSQEMSHVDQQSLEFTKVVDYVPMSFCHGLQLWTVFTKDKKMFSIYRFVYKSCRQKGQKGTWKTTKKCLDCRRETGDTLRDSCGTSLLIHRFSLLIAVPAVERTFSSRGISSLPWTGAKVNNKEKTRIPCIIRIREKKVIKPSFSIVLRYSEVIFN